MKKRIMAIGLAVMLLGAGLFTGCGQQASTSGPAGQAVEATAVCSNGQFVGQEESETGVLAFKGIPYAEAPVGDLRWKAPVAIADSAEVKEAKEFGKSSIQYEWHSEPITTKRGEDCLTLNVWTSDMETKNKPVMVYFHGGSFAWGGTSEELYNGQYIVEKHPDVIVVTCNYRVGMMGFIDLSSIEGGEAFPDSRELGMLDAVESLRWIQKNIEAFGGDPGNVTIFGESAGSTMVMGLLASDLTEGLYQRAICESGAYNLTFSEEDYADSVQADMLLQATGVNTMDELMALSEEELIAANELELDEDAMTVNDYYSLPLRGGSVINADPYEGIAKAKARGVDIMIGTNENEIAYWVAEMGEEPMSEMNQKGVKKNLKAYEKYFVGDMYDQIMDTVTEEEQQKVAEYLAGYSDLKDVWAKTNLLTEAMFRQPSIKAADASADADGSGKTYMYLFCKKNNDYDFIGACHASELAYVFHNLNETDFSGTVDEKLADQICEAWVNFAKTGDPGTDSASWTEYNTTDRATMVIGDDCSMKMENDPLGKDRQLIFFLADYNIWSAGA